MAEGKLLLRNVRILVADDSHEQASLLGIILTNQGAVVEIVSGGAKAVSKAMEKSYDVIVLDLEMMSMGGIEATIMLRVQGYDKPIIAITAHPRPEHDKLTEHGFDDFLRKPIDPTTLIAAVARLVGKPAGPS